MDHLFLLPTILLITVWDLNLNLGGRHGECTCSLTRRHEHGDYYFLVSNISYSGVLGRCRSLLQPMIQRILCTNEYTLELVCHDEKTRTFVCDFAVVYTMKVLATNPTSFDFLSTSLAMSASEDHVTVISFNLHFEYSFIPMMLFPFINVFLFVSCI